MGCSMAVVLSVFGAAYGIAKSGVGVSAVSVLRPDMIIRSALSSLMFPLPPLYGRPPDTCRYDATNPRGYPLNLRSCRRGFNKLQPQGESCALFQLHATSGRNIMWIVLSCSRVLHRDRRWCWCEGHCTATSTFRRDDADVDLCWGVGWVHCTC